MNYLDLDFIEIGTSNFDTFIENADEYTKGISIEPVKYYLDQLPNKKNVIKLNCAVLDNDFDQLTLFFVPEDIIIKNNLPGWLKGCNSVNHYHVQHTKLNIEHLVVKEKVNCLTMKRLFENYNIRQVKCLKIDTEGHDCKILMSFLPYLKTKSSEFFPKKIIFETNNLTPKIEIQETIRSFESVGYHLISKSKENTILIYGKINEIL